MTPRGHRLIFLLGCGPALTIAIAIASPADQSAGWVNGASVASDDWADALRFAGGREPDPTKARALATAACVRERIVVELSRVAGLTTVRDDAELRGLHAVENARRAARAAAGERVYGPRQLGWRVFRSTWLDGLRRELLRHEAELEPPDEAVLRAFHAANPTLFRARDGGVLPFEGFRDFVRRQLLEHRLEARIAAAIARAEVRWRPAAIE